MVSGCPATTRVTVGRGEPEDVLCAHMHPSHIGLHSGTSMTGVKITWTDRDSQPYPTVTRSWELPPEPPYTVTRLRCECHNWRWLLRYAPPVAAWENVETPGAPESQLVSWRQLLLYHTRLIDATNEK